MNINFELYRIFYEVANAGNITKASQKLMISQPAVTKHIKQLEGQLGGELFIRTKRGVILTENGKEIYNYIKQGMNCFEAAEMQFTNLKHLETGILRIGVSTALARIYLFDYLEMFHRMYPNVAIQIFTDPSSIMRNMLKDGSLDVLIAREDPVEDDAFEIDRLGILHQCFIASDYYNELRNEKIDMNELNKYPILLQKYPSTSRDYFDKFCAENNIIITTKMEIASATLLEEFVKIGLGVGLITKEFSKKDIDDGSVFVLDTIQEIPPHYFSMITLKNSIHSFGTNKFMDLIKEKIAIK